MVTVANAPVNSVIWAGQYKYGPKIVMVKKQIRGLWPLLAVVKPWLIRGAPVLTVTTAVSVSIGAFFPSALSRAYAQPSNASNAINPEQVPTARYGRGEAVDLALIIDEWRDRYPSLPVFTCTCNAATCGDISIWPFREYERYEPFVALGAFNAATNEANGFNCFDMETGIRPGAL